MKGTVFRSNPVQFAVHDFFAPQPIRNVAVFFLRNLLHDWPDADVRRILSELRQAAVSHTTLILIDYILPYACAPPSDSKHCYYQISAAPAGWGMLWISGCDGRHRGVDLMLTERIA
ncbi:hypothetical protein B0H19DRAFT_186814 [Mycena capillaripes]|nr:hypothetical protein B0H19DRAFT_186814 [Mycena capillaripes]